MALILVFEEARAMLVGNDVHGVTAPPWLAGSIALGELMTLPGLPAVRIGRVHRDRHSRCTASSTAPGWA